MRGVSTRRSLWRRRTSKSFDRSRIEALLALGIRFSDGPCAKVRDVSGVLTVEAFWLVKLSDAVWTYCVSVLKATSANSSPVPAADMNTQLALMGVVT
jgi:hypothetical protein